MLQAPQHSGCLPSAPGATVSGQLLSVMSGAMEGNLENQVVGDPETVAGSSALYRPTSSAQRSGIRVCSPMHSPLSFRVLGRVRAQLFI